MLILFVPSSVVLQPWFYLTWLKRQKTSFLELNLTIQLVFFNFLHFRSFAYVTIKDRLPVILAKIADTVFRSKSWVKEEHGQVNELHSPCPLGLIMNGEHDASIQICKKAHQA